MKHRYETIKIQPGKWQEELIIWCLIPPSTWNTQGGAGHIHSAGSIHGMVKLRQAISAEWLTSILSPHPSPNLILFSQTSLILSKEKSYSGKDMPSNGHRPAQLKEKSPMKSRWRGRGSEEPISSSRKIHIGTDQGPSRPPGKMWANSPTHNWASQLHIQCKLLLSIELIFFSLRFVASRNEMRHSNSFP